jgi:hypothetical protein
MTAAGANRPGGRRTTRRRAGVWLVAALAPLAVGCSSGDSGDSGDSGTSGSGGNSGPEALSAPPTFTACPDPAAVGDAIGRELRVEASEIEQPHGTPRCVFGLEGGRIVLQDTTSLYPSLDEGRTILSGQNTITDTPQLGAGTFRATAAADGGIQLAICNQLLAGPEETVVAVTVQMYGPDGSPEGACEWLDLVMALTPH